MSLNRERAGSAELISEDLERYMQYEYLAHYLAYADFLVDGLSLNLDLKGNNEKPYVVKAVKVPHSGLYCFILVPEEACKVKEVFILFRGTKCLSSLFRDLEPGAAGIQSMAEALPCIIEDINKTLERMYSRDVEITVCGHSLGGADAQNCYVALMKEADMNPLNFHKVKKLTLAAFNAAGVIQQVADEADSVAMSLCKKKYIKLKCLWLHAAGDVVQQTGQNTILAGASINVAEVHLVKARTKGEEAELKSYFELFMLFSVLNRTYLAHTNYYFRDDVKNNVTLEYYNNSTTAGREIIQKKLTKKMHFLQNFKLPQYAFMKIRHYFTGSEQAKASANKLQLIHIKREIDIRDLWLNATSMSVAFNEDYEMELRMHMPVQFQANEQLDKALIPYISPTCDSDNFVSITLPILQSMLHQYNEFCFARSIDNPILSYQPAAQLRPLIEFEENKQVEEKRVDINAQEEEKGEEGQAPVIVWEEPLDERRPLNPAQQQHPDAVAIKPVSSRAVLIGAILGIAVALGVAMLFPPAVLFVQSLLHLSTAALSNVIATSLLVMAGTLSGGVLGKATSHMTSLSDSGQKLELPDDGNLAINPPESDRNAPFGTLANLHRQHGLKINIPDENDEVNDAVNIEVIPVSVNQGQEVKEIIPERRRSMSL